jgi:hypothetical protein
VPACLCLCLCWGSVDAHLIKSKCPVPSSTTPLTHLVLSLHFFQLPFSPHQTRFAPAKSRTSAPTPSPLRRTPRLPPAPATSRATTWSKAPGTARGSSPASRASAPRPGAFATRFLPQGRFNRRGRREDGRVCSVRAGCFFEGAAQDRLRGMIVSDCGTKDLYFTLRQKFRKPVDVALSQVCQWK